ncbi:MAG: hypothetical protein A2170_11200 [Deltaproteobacteria bacterium RBG_13_53_10]|nr:MAG: hypothetical protein A2170_11200 [Deltaproteobacteria bacterium RBG_13_53_10]
MASIEGSMAAMSKALESQNLIAELVTEGAEVMDPNAAANTSTGTSEAVAEVSSAVTGLGRVLDLII